MQGSTSSSLSEPESSLEAPASHDTTRWLWRPEFRVNLSLLLNSKKLRNFFLWKLVPMKTVYFCHFFWKTLYVPSSCQCLDIRSTLSGCDAQWWGCLFNPCIIASNLTTFLKFLKYDKKMLASHQKADLHSVHTSKLTNWHLMKENQRHLEYGWVVMLCFRAVPLEAFLYSASYCSAVWK